MTRRSSPSPEISTSCGPSWAAVPRPALTSLHGDAHAEHAQPIDEVATDLDGQVAVVHVEEAAGVQQHAVEHVVRCRGQRPQRGRLRLEQRQPRLGQQAGHRQHCRRQPVHRRIVAVALGDSSGRVHGVQPPGADLVGPRQHGHRVDRRRRRDRAVHEGVEELDVGPVEVAHQVDDRVGVRRVRLVVGQEVARAARVLVVDRRQPRRVDQRHVLQGRGRPLDVEPGHVPLGQVTELDVERAGVAGEGQLLLAAGRQLGGDAVADAVAVPADHARALTGVGRRQPFADEGVQQRRLAGLDPAGDGHSHGAVQPLHDLA